MQSLQSPAQYSFQASQNHVLPFLVGTTALEKKTDLGYQKENFSSLMRTDIRQSKLSTTKAEEAYNEPVAKNAKIILYME